MPEKSTYIYKEKFHDKYCYFEDKTRALSQNVTNAPEGALTPYLKNVKVTVKKQEL